MPSIAWRFSLASKGHQKAIRRSLARSGRTDASPCVGVDRVLGVVDVKGFQCFPRLLRRPGIRCCRDSRDRILYRWIWLTKIGFGWRTFFWSCPLSLIRSSTIQSSSVHRGGRRGHKGNCHRIILQPQHDQDGHGNDPTIFSRNHCSNRRQRKCFEV
jgi:hypothetical protein